MEDQTDPRIEALMRAPLKTVSDREALGSIGALIDLAGDAGYEPGLTRAFVQLKSFERRKLAPADQATVHYFRANGWGARRRIRTKSGPRQWEQPERADQILELFRALHHEGFSALSKVRRCQILTNLGLMFNDVGRFIEAIELWDAALSLLPTFGMALGSRGTGFKYYGLASADGYDREILLLTAHRAFAATTKRVLWDGHYPPEVRQFFASGASEIAEHLDLDAIAADYRPEEPSLGRSRREQSYRRWALRHRLFINPLNDCGADPVAASDHLMLPPLTVGLETSGPPPVIGLFNQMKQEYAFARLLLYEGTQDDGLHFADRRVQLSDTLDYPSYSISAEKTRTAFRLAYSLLDKVGYFINAYWALGTENHRVGFRSVWYAQGDSSLGLHTAFQDYENWPLHGLFWLSKDLFDDKFQRVTNPDAREIFIIRNHLEHKYLQLHEMIVGEPASGALGMPISEHAFATKALRILKMARAAMIYLPLAVHREEVRRKKHSPPGWTGQFSLHRYNDWRKGS